MRKLIFLAILSSFLYASSFALSQKNVVLIKIEGGINPASADFISQSIEKAEDISAEALVIQLDTPGGLLSSTRVIVKKILNASVPVITYVAPSGAHAGSAGVMITLAGHVAAMAPGTNIGAAHPVTATGGDVPQKELAKKIENDTIAFIESIAQRRGRNTSWAIKAVKESVSITDKKALKLKVIDLIARDLGELLDEVDGRVVEIGRNKVKLNTKGAEVITLRMNLKQKVLNALSDPNIAYMLLMIGMAGLYFELAHPGTILPGVLGAMSLILAFVAFHTLPINYGGLLLMLLAIILLIAEIKVQSYGLLTIAAIISLTLGSLMLFETPEETLRVSWKVLLPSVVLISGFFIIVLTLALKVQMAKPLTGMEGLYGEIGQATTHLRPEGKVFVHGEYWDAIGQDEVSPGEKVKVVGFDGMKIKVTRIN